MKKSFSFACFGAFCTVVAGNVSAAEGVVTADVLNVRTRPNLAAEVVDKLAKGSKVEVFEESGEFVEIAIPMTAPVYISAVYLNPERTKTTAPLSMYMAGSKSAFCYGVLPKGSDVKLIEIDRNGWARIEPPAGIRLYAAKRFVAVAANAAKPETAAEEKNNESPAEKPETAAEEKNNESPAEKPVVTEEGKNQEALPAAKPETAPVEKKDLSEASAEMGAATQKALEEIGIDLQKGTAVTATGTLQKIEHTTVPILQFVLRRKTGTPEYYYLCSDRFPLSDGSAQVTIRGRAFQVPDWRVPVLYIESISPMPSSTKTGK